MMVPELFAARLILVCIFLIASISKFASFSTLASDILEYQILSQQQARVIAYLLPFAELFVGLFYLTGLMLVFASVLAIVLLLIFTAAIAINLARKERFSCHCFGSSNSMIGPAMVVRNLILLALAFWILLRVPMVVSFGQLSMLWQRDVQQLVQLNTLIPLIGTIALAFSILFLLGDIDTYFYRGKTSIEANA